MIKARTRRIIQGSDYSAQEPRLLSQLCMDEGMLKAYRDGKDLYVEIASISFHIPYKYCLEHFPKGAPIKLVDGKWEYAKLKNGQDDDIQNFEDLGKYLEPNFNPDLYDYDKLADGEKDSYKKGKAYRGQAKKILLGIMYGRGKKSIAEQLGCSIEEAEQIKNNVYEAFPRIKVFEEESTELVKQKGYVTTLWGRKRRLPEYNLPPYSIYYLIEKEQIKKNKKTVTQVPDTKNKVPQAICEELYRKLNSLRGWDARNEFIDKKKKDGILIVDNHSAIAQASRQIINSRVQGSAADMSKLALIKIHEDEELIKRGVKEIIPVHDEILIETPLRYARFVEKRFSHDMEVAAKPALTIPIYCDVENATGWARDQMDLEEELKNLPII